MENNDQKPHFDKTITGKKIAGHLSTITRHKLMVTDLCLKVGLTKQGLLHDLSKYEPVEFITGAMYYTGSHSPNADEKKDKGYSDAWLHHKGRNRHHFEYWMDIMHKDDTGETVLFHAKMPLKYVLEMACDRIAACKVYHGSKYTDRDPWAYYSFMNHAVGPHMHPETSALLEDILQTLANQGEKKALAFMRWLLKHPYVYEGGTYKRRLPLNYSGQDIEEAYRKLRGHNPYEKEHSGQ